MVFGLPRFEPWLKIGARIRFEKRRELIGTLRRNKSGFDEDINSDCNRIGRHKPQTLTSCDGFRSHDIIPTRISGLRISTPRLNGEATAANIFIEFKADLKTLEYPRMAGREDLSQSPLFEESQGPAVDS